MDISKLSFEEAVNELEKSVKRLESGNCGLDESIKIFEEGMALSDLCYKKIDSAKQKITKLIQNSEVGSSDE